MPILIVVNNPKDWAFEIPGVEVVAAKTYITDPSYTDLQNVKLFNLCRSYRYQSTGYYVSLLAIARGHRPIPNIATMRDMKFQTIIRFVSDDLDHLISESLATIQADHFTLSIYFGRNLARRYDRLSLHLFNLFQAPLLRAHFVYSKKKWQLQDVAPIAANDIPENHRAFVVEVAAAYFAGHGRSVRRPRRPRYNMAILVNDADPMKPSNPRAIRRFIKAAQQFRIEAETITRDDFARLAEFDALFIRTTTSVMHHTYRFARRAEAEGLVTVDDSESIVKCSNKVYLAELMSRHKILTPKTLIVHKDNAHTIASELGLPCILKQPDGSFSTGVIKADDAPAVEREAQRLLEKSDLIIAQQFLPTPFDWRIGVFDNKPLFACKYFMVRKHWQIIRHDDDGRHDEGRFETIPVELLPKKLLRTVMRAVSLIGRSLYGVDLKEVDGAYYIVEINDNPNIDAGVEDDVLGHELYQRIMRVFLQRIERRKGIGVFA